MLSRVPTQLAEPLQRNYMDESKSHTRHLLSNGIPHKEAPTTITSQSFLRNPFSSFSKDALRSTTPHRLSLSDNSKFLVCCFMWYLCSSLSSNTGKHIMNTFRYPVTLTFVQFLLVACWSAIVEKAFNAKNIKRPTKIIVQTIVPLSLFMIVGHIFSSISISRIPVSLVHTIKVRIDSNASMGILMDNELGFGTVVYGPLLPIHIPSPLFIQSLYRLNSTNLGCDPCLFFYVFQQYHWFVMCVIFLLDLCHAEHL